MKKILSIVLILAMTLAFATGCAKEPEQGEEVVNPIHDSTQDEVFDATGIRLEAPDGAESVQYRYYNGELMLAEVEFIIDDITYSYRAQLTDATDIKTRVNGTVATDEELEESMKDGSNMGLSLSGYYYDWDACSQTKVGDRPALYAHVNDGPAVVTWLDVVPGVMYTMTMTSDASEDQLMKVVETCFEPMQDDVG